jgi:excisionase family DNA binding protein
MHSYLGSGQNQNQPFFDNLLTREQLAEKFGLSPSFISKMMAKEDLPYLKIGRAVRFRVSEVVIWLQTRRRP